MIPMLAVSLFLQAGGLAPVIASPQEPDDSSMPAPAPPRPPGIQPAGPLFMPPNYWARNLRLGQDTIVDGVVLRHLPLARPARVLIAGIPMDDQPRFSLEPIEALADSTSVESTGEVLAQTRRFAEWAAGYYGAGLPPQRQRELAELYDRTANFGAELARLPRQDSAGSAALRLVTASFLADRALEERRLFAAVPAAQVRRYGQVLRGPRADPGADRLRTPVLQMLGHEGSPVQSLPKDTTGRRRLPGFRAPMMEKALPFRKAYCQGPDTVVIKEPVGDADVRGMNLFEVRIYLATHQVVPEATDILKDLGLYDPMMRHTSVVASIWQLERMHYLTLKYVVPAHCAFPSDVAVVQMENILTDLTKDSIPKDSIKTTAYLLVNSGWYIGNGASGRYDAADQLETVLKASFASWEDASKWLFTPTPSPSGKYYRMRAAAYSIGDYGWNFICHNVANAFSVRRWGVEEVIDPLWEAWFGLYGNKGISHRLDWLHQVHAGCVPGKWCYYNVYPPYGSPYDDLTGWMNGEGYGLDEYFNPNKGEWQFSGADFKEASIPFGLTYETVSELPGWQ